MIRRPQFAPLAVADLMGLETWVAEQADEAIAEAYIARVTARVAALGDFPHQGTPRDDFGQDVRTIVFERRLVIAYRVDGEDVTILRVVHGARDLGGALSLDEV